MGERGSGWWKWAGGGEAPKDYIPIFVEREVRGTRYKWVRGGELESLEAGRSQLRMRSNACRIRLPFACCCTLSTPPEPRLSTPPTGNAAGSQ